MDIGIDLGTTFSVLAVPGRQCLVDGYPDPIYLDEVDVTIIPTPYGSETFPSVAVEEPSQRGQWLFGAEALQQAELGNAPIMFSKRKMGTREEFHSVSGPVTARQVATHFLRYLKECAEAALGQPVHRAIITHPAYFDRAAVEDTRGAAIEAGFDMSLVEQMLMEPVAAALAYTQGDPRDPLRILTYDLGGGTFDVSYLERTSGVIAMRGFDGDPLLGGYNFDREIIHWVRRKLQQLGRRVDLDEDNPDHRARLASLLQLAENVKIALANAKSDSTKVDIRWRNVLVDVDGKAINIDEKITRAEFVELIRPLLERTVAACYRALERAGVAADELDEILFVGGSSRGPWIRDMVRQIAPTIEPKLYSPDLCVAAGAAIFANLFLPKTVHGPAYRLTLDVPQRASAPEINLVGSVSALQPEVPVQPGLKLRWRSPYGELRHDQVQDDGRFFVPDVALIEESENKIHLDLLDPDGKSLLQHDLKVLHSADTQATVGFSTVLPRMLSIETIGGLVPLAEEGLTLPARCRPPEFEITSNSPLISLKIFQEFEPVGAIRITGLPPEGCRGAFVRLTVDLTEKCQLLGQAEIVTPDGRLVLTARVELHIEIPAIPSVAELHKLYAEHKARFQDLLTNQQHLVPEIEAPGRKIISAIEHQFSQQPIERQEIQQALRQLGYLVDPPDDEMTPTRREFSGRIAQLRRALNERCGRPDSPPNRDDNMDGRPDPSGDDCRKELSRERASTYLNYLDRLESEALAAHERRDRRAWANVQDGLDQVTTDVIDFPALDSLPPFLNKLLALRQIQIEGRRLEQRRQNLQEAGDLGEWHDDIKRIEHGLNEAAHGVMQIDDDIAPELALAKIREIIQQKVTPLEEQINRLGVHVMAH